LCLSLVLLLAACGSFGGGPDDSGGSPNESATLRVGQIRNNLEPLLQAAGVLDNLSYDIEWSTFESGPQAIEAERSGAVDIAYMADTPPIFARAAGVDVRIVGLTRAPQGARYVALLVADGSSVTDVGDLVGKRVASVPGTITQYLLLRALEGAGAAFDAVEHVDLQGPDAITALSRGDVDAIVLVDPLAATAMVSSDARVLLTGERLLSGSNAFVAAGEALKVPATVTAMGDLLSRAKTALRWAGHHPRDWAVVYGEMNQLPAEVSVQAVRRTVTQMVPIDSRAVDAQQEQADAFLAIGVLPSAAEADGLFDDRYNEGLFPTAP
jgi:sulfonate transport system substrate-binding protein